MSAVAASLLLTLTLVVVDLSLVSSFQGPEVSLPLGKVKGIYQESVNGRKISSFLGIPYAQPPIAELRFKEPVPVKPWAEILDATVRPNICLQSNTRNVGSEDCLYLNVYTPEVPEQGDVSKLDVIFVIHGGGFQDGYGHLHGPEYLLDEKDVVMVTFNYRLGILGFLSLQDDVLPGNYGLKDQLLALKWVKENIAAFGGDPNKITLIGCSAGSASVHFHVLSQKSKGLFHKAIALSGSALNPWAIDEHPKSKTVQIAEALACPVDVPQEMVECLRKLPAELVTSQALLFLKFLIYEGMAVMPVVEKPSAAAFLDRSPVEIIKTGQAYDIPLLITHTDDDALFLAAEIFTNSTAVRELEDNWEDILPVMLYYRVKDELKSKVANSIKDYYLGDKSISETPEQFTRLMSDRFLILGIQEAAKLHAENSNSPVYSYLLTHTGGKRLSDIHNHIELYKGGAVHADDFLYVFHSPEIITKRTGDPVEDAMSQTMINLWLEFIQKTPVPGWKTVQSSLPNLAYLEIAGSEIAQVVFKTKTDFSAEQFWKSLPLEENIDENVNVKTNDEL